MVLNCSPRVDRIKRMLQFCKPKFIKVAKSAFIRAKAMPNWIKLSSFWEQGANQSTFTYTPHLSNQKIPIRNIATISNILSHDICRWQAIAQRVEKIYFLWHKLSASAYISLEMFHKFMLDYFNYFYSNFVYSIWCLAQLWMTANANSFLWKESYIRYF